MVSSALNHVAGRARVRAELAWLDKRVTDQMTTALTAWRLELEHIKSKVQSVQAALETTTADILNAAEAHDTSSVANRLQTQGYELDQLISVDVLPALGQNRSDGQQESALGSLETMVQPLALDLPEHVIAVSDHIDLNTVSEPAHLPAIDVPLRAIATSYLEGEFSFGLHDARNDATQLVARVSQRLAEIAAIVSYGLQSAESEARAQPATGTSSVVADELAQGALERATRIIEVLNDEIDESALGIAETIKNATTDVLEHIRRDALGNTQGPKRRQQLLRQLEERKADAQSRLSSLGRHLITLPQRLQRWLRDNPVAYQERLRRGVDQVDAHTMAQDVKNLAPSAEALEALPYILTKLFVDGSQDLPQLPVGADAQTTALADAWQEFQTGHPTAVLVSGQQGNGKSSITRMTLKRLAGRHFTRVELDPLTRSEGGLASAIGVRCGAFECHSFANVAQHLTAQKTQRVLLLDGLEHAFTRSPAGLALIRGLLSLIAQTKHKVLWIVSVSAPCARLLDRLCGLKDWFSLHLHFGPRDATTLGEILDARCRLSGFAIAWPKVDEGRLWTSLGRLSSFFRARNASDRRARFYEQLTLASGGNVQDAMTMWLNGIDRIEGDTIYLKPVIRPQLPWFDQLGRDAHRLLALIILSASITLEEGTIALRWQKDRVQRGLTLLESAGIVRQHPEPTADRRLVVWSPAWRLVCEALESRHLLPRSLGAQE